MLGSAGTHFMHLRVGDSIAVYSTFCLKITTAKKAKAYAAVNPYSESFCSNILNENNPEGSIFRIE